MINYRHTHKCPDCGTSWTHGSNDFATKKAWREGHVCPKCGQKVFAICIELTGLLAAKKKDVLTP